MGFVTYPKELNGMDPQDIYATERLLLAMGTHLHHYMPANQAKIVQKMHELTEEAVGPYKKALRDASGAIGSLLGHLDANFNDTNSCWVEQGKKAVEDAKELVK